MLVSGIPPYARDGSSRPRPRLAHDGLRTQGDHPVQGWRRTGRDSTDSVRRKGYRAAIAECIGKLADRGLVGLL